MLEFRHQFDLFDEVLSARTGHLSLAQPLGRQLLCLVVLDEPDVAERALADDFDVLDLFSSHLDNEQVDVLLERQCTRSVGFS